MSADQKRFDMPDCNLSDLQCSSLSEERVSKLKAHGVMTARELLALLSGRKDQEGVSRYLDLGEDEREGLLTDLRQLFTSEELQAIDSVTFYSQPLGCLEEDDEYRPDQDPQEPGERT